VALFGRVGAGARDGGARNVVGLGRVGAGACDGTVRGVLLLLLEEEGSGRIRTNSLGPGHRSRITELMTC